MKKKNYLQPQTKAKAIDGERTMQNGSPSEPMPFDPKDGTQDALAGESEFNTEDGLQQRSLWDD